MTDKILMCLCSAFALERTQVSERTTQLDVEEWDSIGSVRLILCLEEEFNVSIPPEVGRRMTGCREIEDELKRLGAVAS
jgi:acyl carrier protein